ncbi:hypothetical protein [Secundilactobacillus collinoides]|uniref:Uncharacterized protein n=1 Tax=Secundilactobacillus collinoides TaxID=33960 RepID=A0A166HDM9_SECCO|nr:hypothetical protein [Secundilactobacillus collinoides]KZL42455.1 hypothetical protein TY91_04840 [Secundilactobacillus collinoides]
MKLNQWMILGVSGVLIGAGAPIGVHASSLPGYDSSYWFKWRTKHVRKSVYVYQINPSTWKIRQRKILYKGTKIRLFNSANLSWTIKASKLHATHGYTWVVKGHYNTSWLR